MKIKDKIKKNGQKVYYASVYLGVDQLTGKKARTTVTATTKKGGRVKARDAINAFAANGYTVKDKPTITTYKELVKVWWIVTKIQLNQILANLWGDWLECIYCLYLAITSYLNSLRLLSNNK